MALFLTASMLAGCGSSPAGGQASSGSHLLPVMHPEPGRAAGEEEQRGYQTTYGSKMFDDVTISVELFFDRSNAPEGSTIPE